MIHAREIIRSASLVLAAMMSGGQVASAAEAKSGASAARPLPAYIGTATMQADGSLVLWLRAEDESGSIVGHGTMTVRPGDPQYEEVRRHIGITTPGETKPVPAWPDEGPDSNEKADGAIQDKDAKP